MKNYIYYIYKITNKINQKYYIGVHKTKNINDNYMGSGKGIKLAIKKYGVDNFEKKILCVVDDKETAYKIEKILLESLWNINETYNMKEGGVGGFTYQDSIKGSQILLNREGRVEELKIIGNKVKEMGVGVHSLTKKQLSEAGRKGALKRIENMKNNPEKYDKSPSSPETKEKISTSMKKYYENNKRNEESRKKQGDTRKERGYSMSNESKEKLSQSMKLSWEKRKSR